MAEKSTLGCAREVTKYLQYQTSNSCMNIGRDLCSSIGLKCPSTKYQMSRKYQMSNVHCPVNIKCPPQHRPVMTMAVAPRVRTRAKKMSLSRYISRGTKHKVKQVQRAQTQPEGPPFKLLEFGQYFLESRIKVWSLHRAGGQTCAHLSPYPQNQNQNVQLTLSSESRKSCFAFCRLQLRAVIATWGGNGKEGVKKKRKKEG